MKPVAKFLMTFAVAAAASCSWPAGHADVPPPAGTWHDTGTPPDSLVLERQPRYDVDEPGHRLVRPRQEA